MEKGEKSSVDFRKMGELLAGQAPPVVSLASAQDEESVKTLKDAYERGIARAVLVGDRDRILAVMDRTEFQYRTEIIHEPDDRRAAAAAVSLVKSGQADVLMKGLINSSDYLHEVLEGEHQAGKRGFLSHLAAFQMPGADRLIFHTDGGLNIAPDMEGKKQILINALSTLHKLGYKKPKVAVLTANEVVNPKMPATLHAAELRRMYEEGLLPECILEGPITMDVALSREAARHKGISSEISGEVDLFLMPNIESGNIAGKALVLCAGAKMAGMVLGTDYPIVLTSRAENSEGKLNSLILACYAGRKRSGNDL